MTTPSDITGYLQGFRFSDDPTYYDSTAKHWYDQAGYEALGNGATVIAGTPTFSTRNSKRAIALDNLCHIGFQCAIPWEGAALLIYDVEVLTASFVGFLLLTGSSAGTTSSRTGLRLTNGGGSLKHRVYGTGGTLFSEFTQYGPVAHGFATSQDSRTAFQTKDGVTVTETAAVSGTTGTNASFFITSNIDDYGFNSVIGNLGAVQDSTTVFAGCKVHLWEAHFFKDNPYVEQASAMAALIAAKKAEYGIA